MKRFSALLLLAALAALAACTDDGGGQRRANQRPQVWLSSAPPEGSTGKYTVKLFWGGWDPDGEISHYQYLVTDNRTGVFDPQDLENGTWTNVVANDSTFTFSADSLVNPNATNLATTFVRSHTFFIRAVDQEGLESDHAYRSFTARTLSPDVTIEVPRASGGSTSEVPPIATFRWRATDYVDDINTKQDPDSVQYVLKSTVPFGGDFVKTLNYLRTPASLPDWSDWVYYKMPDDGGRSWTTPPQEFGTYVLAVRAKDEAGAVTPVLDERHNARRIRVSTRNTGPLFYLHNTYMGRVATTVCSTPPTILDIPAGVPLDFRLMADASSYGGIVSGYRYGWDIVDLEDPEQWEVDFTPFVTVDQETGYDAARTPSRRFFFGTHVFTAEVIDNSGFCSRIEVKVNIIQFSLERNVLVVDDFLTDNLNTTAGWEHPTGRGFLPTDAEHDAFWVSMMQNVDGFDPTLDMIATVQGGTVPLTKLATYKSIIWSNSGSVLSTINTPELYRYLLHRSTTTSTATSGKVVPNLLALTMAAGGHILIAGHHPVQHVIPRVSPSPRFPFIFLYELEGAGQGTPPDVTKPTGTTDFAYRELCLETIDYTPTSLQRLRHPQGLYCRVLSGLRSSSGSQRDDSMREALPLDPNFPLLRLRPECSAPGKWYDPAVRGLDVEVYNAQYFATFCQYVPDTPRSCFQPIYGVGCFDTAEPTYNQPVAFFTSAYADKVADVPGAVAARSAVFGFEPVFFNPDEVRVALDYVMFDEWKLPRKPTAVSQ